jgi:putative hydrolase of HD superfamily
MATLWGEQELGQSEEAKLVKVVDRMLPFLHNIWSEVKTWREAGIKRSQIDQAHRFIADAFPTIHAWMQNKIQYAVDQGWLLDA